MKYREKAVTRIEDFDDRGKLTPTAMLKLFENAAVHHSNAVTDHVMDDSLKGIAWVLMEWRVEIARQPDFRDALSVETWVTGSAPASRSRRQARLVDGSGETAVRAEAKFALYDMVNKRVAEIGEELFTKYQPEAERLFDGDLPRFTVPEDCEGEKEIAVRRADMDFNGHVHNTVYLDYAAELLPWRAPEGKRPAAFRVLYLRQLTRAGSVTVRGGEKDGEWKIGIFSEGKLAAGVEVAYRTRSK